MSKSMDMSHAEVATTVNVSNGHVEQDLPKGDNLN